MPAGAWARVLLAVVRRENKCFYATTSYGQSLFWFWPPHVLNRGPDPGFACDGCSGGSSSIASFSLSLVARGACLPFVFFPPSFLTLLLSLPSHFPHSPLPQRGLPVPPLHPLFFVSFHSRSQRCNVPLSGRTYDGLLPVRSLCDSAVLLFSFRPSITRDASAQNTSLASMLPGVHPHLRREGKRA